MSVDVVADSSALVKLYADEQGCAEVRQLAHLVVSQLARVEVPTALRRKHRMGELVAGVHGLRGYDAMQLASALAVAAALPENITFLAYESALVAAAAAEGLAAPAPHR